MASIQLKEGVHQNFIFSWNKEFSSPIEHCPILLVCHAFFTILISSGIKLEHFLDENSFPDVKVLVLDVKVLVPDVKVLVPRYGSTGPQMWKYWSLDVSNCFGYVAGKVWDIFEKKKADG